MPRHDLEKGAPLPPTPIYTSKSIPNKSTSHAGDESPPDYDYPAEISRLVYLNMQSMRDDWHQPVPPEREAHVGWLSRRTCGIMRCRLVGTVLIVAFLCFMMFLAIHYGVESKRHLKDAADQPSHVISPPTATTLSFTATNTHSPTSISSATQSFVSESSTPAHTFPTTASSTPAPSAQTPMAPSPSSATQQAADSATQSTPAPSPMTAKSTETATAPITSTVTPRVGFCGTPGMACAG